jgi:phosphate transport system substrate-binding protein
MNKGDLGKAYAGSTGLLLTGLLLLTLGACAGGEKKIPMETFFTGSIQISVDESFRPVIDEQLKVFISQHPDAHIQVNYKPEADCLRDLDSDSTRMVIVTRGLSDAELNDYKGKLTYAPSFGIIAWDAIAVVTNKRSPDSIFTMADLRSIAAGGQKYKVVLDGKNATSTVRYAVDSLLRGKPLGKNIEGASNSLEVINYIAEHTDAIGLVGVSWIGNPDDPEQQSFLQKVNIASVECKGCTAGPYVKPYQANIYSGRYPMVRPLYYILKENFEGLGSGFRNFLSLEKGQRIFKRAYLLPARMSFEVQNMSITQ